MTKAFSKFRNGTTATKGVIWQEIDTLFPFKCDVCRREFNHGGKRFIASSLSRHSHYAVGCKCEDCKNGINPNRIKEPKLAERRTELD